MNSSSLNRFFLIFSLILVTMGIATGFWLLGSPQLQRQLKADEKRLKNLHQIAEYLHREEVKSRSQNQNFQLPKALPKKDYIRDPISEKSYEYKIIDGTDYQLCASFATDSKKERKKEYSYRKIQEFWHHSPGKNCYQFDAKETPPTIYDYSNY